MSFQECFMNFGSFQIAKKHTIGSLQVFVQEHLKVSIAMFFLFVRL